MIPLLQIGQIGLGLYIANHALNTLRPQGPQCVDSEPQCGDPSQSVGSGPQGVVGTDGVADTEGDRGPQCGDPSQSVGSGPQGVVGADGVAGAKGDNSDALRSIRDEVIGTEAQRGLRNGVREQRKSIVDESLDSILAKRKPIVFKDGLSGSFTYARISMPSEARSEPNV